MHTGNMLWDDRDRLEWCIYKSRIASNNRGHEKGMEQILPQSLQREDANT